MRILVSIVLTISLLASMACGPKPLTLEQYATSWAGVMGEFERASRTFPEPKIEPGMTVEQKRAAVADALVAASNELDRVSKMQDALRPPSEAAKLHEVSSAFFRKEVALFREYADTARTGGDMEAVSAKVQEHHGMIEEIRAEAVRIGVESKVE